ncbi:MAG: hypothetical protein RIT81_18665 [Deltaproteobacteria bacterium]
MSRWIAMFAGLLVAGTAYAEPTLELSVSGPKEVFEGDPASTSLDAQGQIHMGPTLVDLTKGTDHPIVTMHPSASGGAYAGTAGGGLLSVSAGGRVTTLFEASKESVSAIARLGGKVYAATIPDGSIVRVEARKKTTPVVKPEVKYVWALHPDGKDLIAATGDPGQVLRVRMNGTTEVLFDPDEKHVRALVNHDKRGWIAGGGDKGIVYQLTKDKKAVALYDSTMEEVTAFAVDPKSGDLFASFVSESKAGTLLPNQWIGPVKGDSSDDSSPIKGSEIVRISSDGHVEKLWSSKTEGAMDLHFDAKARRLLFVTAASKKGRARVYAIDTADRNRLLLLTSLDAPIATSILAAPTGGAYFVGTAPRGQINRVGPGLRTKSEYISKEQDLRRSSKIGRLWFDADVPKGAKVTLAIRGGNTKEHDDTWTDWAGAVTSADGGPVDLPRTRYVQIRAELSGGTNAAPVVKSLHASVVRQNIAPKVTEVFMLRRGVYMASLPKEDDKEKTVTLSSNVIRDLRKPERNKDRTRARQGSRPGMMTVAWTSTDPNGDDLLYRVEMTRLDPPAMDWNTVADGLTDQYWSFDSRAYPDGRYRFRVTASDRPANPPDAALTDRFESEPFVVDNGAPKIRKVAARSTRAGRVRIEAVAEDDTSAIGVAEFAVGGGPWLMLPAKDGLVDAKSEALAVDVTDSEEVGAVKLGKGKRTVLIRVEDDAGNEATASTTVDVR